MAAHRVEKWKTGDSFENLSGGWGGTVVGQLGSSVYVIYDGDSFSRVSIMQPDQIKRPEPYKPKEPRHA